MPIMRGIAVVSEHTTFISDAWTSKRIEDSGLHRGRPLAKGRKLRSKSVEAWFIWKQSWLRRKVSSPAISQIAQAFVT